MSQALISVVAVATCAGSLILHLDGTLLACTEDEEGDCCPGP
jgi:hypothetical protein